MKDYSEPRMHTAEHILNQTMVRMFHKGRAFSSHIEKKKSKCDYRFDRDLAPAEKEELERRVNEIIAAAMPVREERISREEAAKMLDMARLPPDAGEDIRIIRIGDYDACPCIGQHVESTRAIGTFRLISTSYENGVLRVRFKLETPS